MDDGDGGGLFIFDTDLRRSEPALDSPNLWAVDGNLLAAINPPTTGEVLKLVDFSDIDAQAVTAFAVDPPTAPDAISLDANAGWIVVRNADTFYIYDINAPEAGPTEIARDALQGGAGGLSELHVSGDHVAFYDDENDFTLLQISTLSFTQPSRNPGADFGLLGLESERLAYFVDQTEDDGAALFANRALAGTTDDLTDLVDPAGEFINGEDQNDGRVGFGKTLSVSPDGRFVFVAGDADAGVAESERLYLSIDGGDFLIVEDGDDPLNALRASEVDASNNLVVFLIPADLSDPAHSDMAVGYATLPPK